MGDHLIVQDQLAKADVILVLAGDDNGERVDEGVKLFKQGYAPYMLMSGGPLAWKLGYAQWMKKQAVENGIPPEKILLQSSSESTLDDALLSLPIVKAHHFRSMILVTSPQHTRRAARVFKKVFGPEAIRVIVRPAEKSKYHPDRWWTRHEDTSQVVWEYVSMLFYSLKGY
jgi:uncharacterized SAM-binding protein YcdF (DUF218 family)